MQTTIILNIIHMGFLFSIYIIVMCIIKKTSRTCFMQYDIYSFIGYM